MARAMKPKVTKPAAIKHRLSRRRQWGTDKQIGAAPIMHDEPTTRTLSLARFAVFFTVAAFLGYLVERVVGTIRDADGWLNIFETLAYVMIVALLTLAALSFLIARLGHLTRIQQHHRVPRAVIDNFFAESIPTLTVIIPSYREDRRVVWQTMVTAGLQEYPHMRVVLLIDDPPHPGNPEHIRILQESRQVVEDLAVLLLAPRRRFEAALDEFESGDTGSEFVDGAELERLAAYYDEAALWFVARAAEHEVYDHSDVFLVDDIYLRLQRDFETHADALREAISSNSFLSRQRVQKLYRRLAWTFRVEFQSFERKQFASLSHESNKAMNLNSYIGLMGASYHVRETPAGPVLLPVRGEVGSLVIPAADYVLTLDADSTLLPEYCLRLVHFMEQPENADVAVVQTPYSAYRGAPTRIERIAGATTDLQHIVHQGLTHHNATFWVGANAVIRATALESIKQEENLAGFTVRRYIQDRTVIEDTESSLDMRAQGWRLHNYPERLSYSATPPDFGSLSIQRQRWANGGLVILPKLGRLLRSDRVTGGRISAMEGLLRANYLASIAWVSLGLLVLLLYPFDQRLLSPLAVFTAVPYFAMQASDLRRVGYKRRDIFRLYGLNLLLLPVNLSGALKSVGQAIGGQKIAFARTPKVKNRTVTRLSFLLIPIVIVIWSLYTLLVDLRDAHYIHAAFALLNGGLTLYAIIAFVGLRHTLTDIVYGVFDKALVPVRSVESEPVAPSWATLLYHGSPVSGESAHTDAMAAALSAVDQQADGSETIAIDRTIRHATQRSLDVRSRRRERRSAVDVAPVRTTADSTLAEVLAQHLESGSDRGTIVLRLSSDGVAVSRVDDADQSPEIAQPAGEAAGTPKQLKGRKGS